MYSVLEHVPGRSIRLAWGYSLSRLLGCRVHLVVGFRAHRRAQSEH